MLNHETVNRLRYMKLTGMADSLKEQDDDSAFQEMGGKRMAKSMGMNFLVQARLSGIADDYFPESLPGQLATVFI